MVDDGERMLQVAPPFTPKVKSEGDFSNFDKFEDADLKILPKDKYVKEFADFWSESFTTCSPVPHPPLNDP